MGAEPTELISEGYRWGILGMALMWVLKWLLPRGYRFRWIRLYAERDERYRRDDEGDDDDQT